MGFNNMFYNGKPEARAAYLSRPAGIGPEKTFKQPRKIFFLNTYPVVSYLNQHLVMQFKKAYRSTAFFFAIFKRIVDQVNQYLPYFLPVGIYQDGLIIFLFKNEFDTMLLRFQFQRLKYLLNQVVDLEF